MSLFDGRREMLDRFRAGEPRALEEVYRRYRPDVVALLERGFSFRSKERMLRFRGYTQPFDLNNAVQETFMRALKESARLAYDGVRDYKWYLLTIARNVVIDELRRPGAEATWLVEAGPDDEIDGVESAARQAEGSESAEQDLLTQEMARLYRRFVDDLTDEERAFFRARFEEQLSHMDAGRACGRSPMQARTMEKKLRRRFLKYMQSQGYLESYGMGENRGAHERRV